MLVCNDRLLNKVGRFEFKSDRKKGGSKVKSDRNKKRFWGKNWLKEGYFEK